MTDNERKQQLSVAYVHAVAARAGFACERTAVDDDSVDLTIAAKGVVHSQAVLVSPRLEVQLKATSQNLLRESDVVFPLPVKNYDELRCRTMIPRLLVVFVMPEVEDEWLEQTEDAMITRRCAYWRSLLGEPETTNTTSVTVHVPRSHRLTVDGLRGMMETVSRGEPL